MMPYQILEVANTHGGSIEYVLSLIDEFKEYKNYGMKFQPLHPDKIATKDYKWYSVYKELLFTQEEWDRTILRASETKEIWLDVFDTYGTEVFSRHKDVVRGVKLQPSILHNEVVLNEFRRIGLGRQAIILNISGLSMEGIDERISFVAKYLNPGEIWLEVGFQSYPTQLNDSGLVKIEAIRRAFKNKIVFADHADSKGDDAIWLPIFAAMHGADVIEKHIMHSVLETRFDFFSSIDKNKYALYINKLQSYFALKDQPFINERETEYLSSTIQVPICRRRIEKGSLLHRFLDLDYKRTGQPGLSSIEINNLQGQYHLVATEIKEGSTVLKEYFKKATIATIIACRLKSTRLPRKALLKIGNVSSVERCIKSCLGFKDTNFTILATSDLDEDAELRNYTYSPSVIFHAGHPDDVIKRYLKIIDELAIDVIVRVTADMPFVSSEIIEILLSSHFKVGADYTVAVDSAVGSSAEVINTSALNKIKTYFPTADYSEYMTWYFQNNPEHFKLNFVELPKELVRNYRLTLDYDEDLDMFNKIAGHFNKSNASFGIRDIFDFLDKNPVVANINSHLTLKYRTDKELIDRLNEYTKIRTQ